MDVVRSVRAVQSDLQVLTVAEHVKDLLDNARPDVIKQYTKLVQTVRRTPDIALRLPKPGSTPSSATLKPNYLCLQCPNVASLDQRDRHEKGHRFSKSNEKRICCAVGLHTCSDRIDHWLYILSRVQRLCLRSHSGRHTDATRSDAQLLRTVAIWRLLSTSRGCPYTCRTLTLPQVPSASLQPISPMSTPKS